MEVPHLIFNTLVRCEILNSGPWNYWSVTAGPLCVKTSSAIGLSISGTHCQKLLFLHLHWTASGWNVLTTLHVQHWSFHQLCEPRLLWRSVNRPWPIHDCRRWWWWWWTLASRNKKHCSIVWWKKCFGILNRLGVDHECDGQKQTDERTDIWLR